MLNTLRTRPLMCFCLVFLLGSCLAVYIPTLPKLILTGLFLLSAILFGLIGGKIFRTPSDGKRLGKTVSALLISAAVSFGISYVTFDWYTARFSERSGEEDTVTLEITDIAYTSSFGARYYANVLDSQVFNGNFSIILDSADNSYLPRDRMTGTISYKTLSEDINGYNEQRYSLSKGYVIGADGISLSYDERNSGFSLSYFFRELNEKLCNHLFRYTGEENGGLSAALLLGNKEELSDSLSRDFRRLGIIHLLCLSGAHLAILTTLSENILLRLKVKKKTRCLINITATLLFMALTGFSPSLTRAGIMVILANIAYLMKRGPDYLTSLTFACGLIIAVNPFSALDYGLHLSFTAAHSCYISAAVGHRFTSLFTVKKKGRFKTLKLLRNRFVRYLTGTAVFNLIISVNLLPLMWLYYGELSLLSLPANLIYIPLITLLMVAEIAFFLLSPLVIFSPFLTKEMVFLTSVISSTAEGLSSLRGIVLSLDYWFTPIFMIPIVILLLLSFSGRRETLRRTSALGICVFVLFLGAVGIHTVSDNAHTSVEYITKGKNDGILVKSNGQLLACEISDASYSFASALVSHRYDFNCTEIEAYMLTHYHNKHITALEKLTDSCIVRTLILPAPVTETDTEVFLALSEMAEEKGINLILTHRGETDTVTFNGAEIETYPLSPVSRSDHPIIAARITHSEQSIMYLGGSFNEGAEEITVHAEKADVLLFGGHSPVYKTAFDPAIAESKTVYLSEYAKESLDALSEDITDRLSAQDKFIPEKIVRISP